MLNISIDQVSIVTKHYQRIPKHHIAFNSSKTVIYVQILTRTNASLKVQYTSVRCFGRTMFFDVNNR